MKTIPDNLSPKQAWAHLCSHPPLGPETRKLSEAIDYYLAQDFDAPENMPPAARSFMDGYAVRSEDVVQVPARLRLTTEVLMGEIPSLTVGPGEATPIPTGGFLPEGTDAVVMQEDTETQNGNVIVKRSVERNENVQQPGEDFQNGQRLFSTGHALRSQDIAAIGSFGISHVAVFRKPAVRIISTGNELIPFDSQEKNAAKIRETNALALAGAATKFGFRATSAGIIADEMEKQRNVMANGLREADVILVSGGSSVGQRDYTMEVIRSFPDHRVIFHGLAIRPGNPTIFASIGSRYVFGLPGQPVSSLVVFYMFVLPFLLHLSGSQVPCDSYAEHTFRSIDAKTATEIQPLKTKTDYLRLKLSQTTDGYVATPIPGKSASLSTLARADGFTAIPPGEQIIASGSKVRVFLFP